ncbi:NUDIX hydrolase [Terribacillus halophilus]|jgi:ADP-ribose pyrophosphatase|uniref:NUDIX hydrolase n=1 Tax=Terribacillus halophilus TaxID=361279 RepID=UPI0009843C82|nr:NUDIX hydrolase [Terribacillus halophilus]
MKKFEEKTIETKPVYDGKVISLRVDTVELPDGNKSKRELIKHPGAVAIIPITKEGKIIFVEQYRKALEKSIVEIPAGKLELGEAPEVTAIRELEEETGYTAKQLKKLGSFYTSPGFADELLHVYEAEELELLTEKVAGDEDEFVELLELTLEEAEALVEEERIHDAKTMYALLHLRLKHTSN